MPPPVLAILPTKITRPQLCARIPEIQAFATTNWLRELTSITLSQSSSPMSLMSRIRRPRPALATRIETALCLAEISESCKTFSTRPRVSSREVKSAGMQGKSWPGWADVSSFDSASTLCYMFAVSERIPLALGDLPNLNYSAVQHHSLRLPEPLR